MRRPAAARLIAALLLLVGLAGLTAGAGCGDEQEADAGALRVMASATFLADIAQNVAGDRFTVESLVPRDADLHAFEPTPRDLAAVDEADLFILNGGGLEAALEDTLRTAAADTTFVVASDGITPREPQPGEPLDGSEEGREGETDPHFWLDPTLVAAYVENIRDAFVAADPEGRPEYAANADAYIAELESLDTWIRDRVATLPREDRLLVMNHMSHGYFADRYGLRIVGAVIPSIASGESPTAKQLAALTETIRREGVRAIFVELDENPELAAQIAAETGIVVVDDLRDHSLSEPGGGAATYIEMMKYDTERIVDGLK
ncbi:MAG: zinc ABC transporter solute-binding protein [Actinobacteria bacterium]|nr:zinc ABC transporter solute-binding protein [Actinomycetota bacterium]